MNASSLRARRQVTRTPRTPLLTTDCVVVNPDRRVLLVERAQSPFKGQLALPGGFVDLDETVEEACRREVMEETGVRVAKLRLVGVFSTPGRDPRGATCTIAFLARVGRVKVRGGDDAAAAYWTVDWQRRDLAFDHTAIVRMAYKLLRP